MERFAAAPRYNIAPEQSAIVVVDGSERTMRWGLLAPWRGHGGKRGPMIALAPRDEIAKTPVLRNAKRCVVPADGFYVWRSLVKKRVPYFLHGDAPVEFEALWAVHKDDGVASFAIVTTQAVAVVAQIATTMPVVVGNEALLGWRADAVSNHVNDLAHDDAQCIALLRNPAQGELF